MKFKKQESIYEQIAESIKDNILSGQWTDSDRIPSVRELAGKLEVNPNTVMRAYQQLQEEGVIYNKRGIGYFVSASASDMILDFRKREFHSEVLPEVFSYLEQLEIDIDELVKYYNEWKN